MRALRGAACLLSSAPRQPVLRASGPALRAGHGRSSAHVAAGTRRVLPGSSPREGVAAGEQGVAPALLFLFTHCAAAQTSHAATVRAQLIMAVDACFVCTAERLDDPQAAPKGGDCSPWPRGGGRRQRRGALGAQRLVRGCVGALTRGRGGSVAQSWLLWVQGSLTDSIISCLSAPPSSP